MLHERVEVLAQQTNEDRILGVAGLVRLRRDADAYGTAADYRKAKTQNIIGSRNAAFPSIVFVVAE